MINLEHSIKGATESPQSGGGQTDHFAPPPANQTGNEPTARIPLRFKLVGGGAK
jgi:hypothetical protein